jgi:hypothetical protein
MALERRNPLPVGRYWLDVWAKDAQAWADFVRANAAALKTERTEHFEENAGGPARDFVIFKTSAPVPWNAKFGFPTIAPSSVQGSGDTVDKLPPETGPELPTLLGGAGVVAGTLAILVGGGLVLGLISAFRR